MRSIPRHPVPDFDTRQLVKLRLACIQYVAQRCRITRNTFQQIYYLRLPGTYEGHALFLALFSITWKPMPVSVPTPIGHGLRD